MEIQMQKKCYEFKDIKNGDLFKWLESATVEDEILMKGYDVGNNRHYAINIKNGKIFTFANGARCLPVDAKVVISD